MRVGKQGGVGVAVSLKLIFTHRHFLPCAIAH
jgi:hypothetical protein